MEEQLELIQNLREQVSELIKLRDKEVKKYNTIESSINEDFNNIQKMNKLLEEMKEQFENAKSSKIFKFSIPCGICSFIITFIILTIYSDFPGGLFNIILSGVCSFVSGTIVSCVPVMILNTFDSFLIKRYSDIKQLHDKINNVNNSIMLSERNFRKMQVDRDTLRTTLKFLEKQLNSKIDEFYEVANLYFNGLEGKTIIIEEGINFTIDGGEHSKRRIRIPDSKKNLGN